VFYNSYSEITGSRLEDKKGRRIILAPVCGNYEQDDLFHSDVKVCSYMKKLALIGDILRFEYTKKYSDLKYLSREYFTEPMPVLNKTITLLIPDWLESDIVLINAENYQIEKHSEKLPNKGLTKISFHAKNLKGYVPENYSLGMQRSYPHILILNKKVNLDKSDQDLLSNLNDKYAWYKKLIDGLDADYSEIGPLVNELTAGSKNDFQKIERIFYWVQDNIKYLAFENGIAAFRPDEAHHVLAKRYGDCKGMANLAKAMLKVAGFDARLSWLGTNSINYDYSLPTLAVDNHQICTVFLDGETYFLDPTEKFVGISSVAERIQGKPVMIENGEYCLLDTIPVLPSEHNLKQYKISFAVENGRLTGNYHAKYEGNSMLDLFRFLNSNEKNKEAKLLGDYLDRGRKNVNFSSLEYENLYKRSVPFTIDASLEMESSVITFSDELYIEIDPYKEFNYFSIEEKRVDDFYIGEKIDLAAEISLQIPSGYQVKHLPGELSLSTDYYSIKCSYELVGNKVKYVKSFRFNQSIIPVEEFNDWNAAIKRLNQFYEDQIVLNLNN
jgi:transglutaminase-like putative cysteine protease